LTLTKSYLHKIKRGLRDPYLGLVHRLDMPVSGIMLMAKSSSAAASLSKQIRDRSIKKTYLAIVEGDPPENGYLSDHLMKDNNTNTVEVVPSGTKRAKLAELFFLKKQIEAHYSLLELTIITGRPHQIRVQLTHAGFPILGDHKYGTGSIQNIALHSYMLSFRHPKNNKKQSIKAEPPDVHPWSMFN
ncbi:MAG: RNA pseudouridine synthase, partial [Bacteroidetes bacterium]|nr:RNA pseudouridine synthase [Bacteroidota bacterium]